MAARCAHVLVVEAPGAWRTRTAVERAVLTRGWRLAVSPADADVLAVCGENGPRLAEAVEVVWAQMPGPRVRVDVTEYDDAAARLDEAHADLLASERHRHDAAHRASASDLISAEQQSDGDMDHGDMDHGDMDHGDMDHGDMDHGDMEMAPAGIPLAQGGGDRDGLEMDVLNVRLGPVLPYWPPGLVLRCSLQGDVIVAAHGELVDEPGEREDNATSRARRLDSVVSLLALAGWDDAANGARRLRDDLLDEDGEDAAVPGLERLHRRVRRARTLRWSLRGLRPVTEGDVREQGLPVDLVGDSYDRLLRLLDRAVAGGEGPCHDPSRDALRPDQVAHLVTGLDLAAARLVVASLDVQRLRARRAEEQEVSHG